MKPRTPRLGRGDPSIVDKECRKWELEPVPACVARPGRRILTQAAHYLTSG
jgi:hypothetical protein